MGIVVFAMIAIPVAWLVALCAWAVWLDRKSVATRAARHVAFVLLIVAALLAAMLVLNGFARMESHYVTAVPDPGPPDKARTLAVLISNAMSSTAFGVMAALPALAWLTFTTWRFHWRTRTPIATREPPYR